ncbi:hypothetical protein [Paractinoplanes atraurantiacus]|uniref:Uncharacterized protein n=1 Tax=Paractinoplanes atraurantiacus TaxID=1036182 RepID=A0A285HRX3_9ACTN|nr:hypothetical protein [Actinoplanes atraurantiacus]SNY38343.1 hypothetical protein SAMN05421748_105209 [Actinoplanes atraurantiacus]
MAVDPGSVAPWPSDFAQSPLIDSDRWYSSAAIESAVDNVPPSSLAAEWSRPQEESARPHRQLGDEESFGYYDPIFDDPSPAPRGENEFRYDDPAFDDFEYDPPVFTEEELEGISAYEPSSVPDPPPNRTFFRLFRMGRNRGTNRSDADRTATNVIRFAVIVLPADMRERYLEEWRGELHDLRAEGVSRWRRALFVGDLLRASVPLAITLRRDRRRQVD